MQKLLSIEQAKPSSVQHTSPCSDCPFRRDALPGWLGGRTPAQYALLACSDEIILCHTKVGPQCAGAAIYRANICKEARSKRVLRLPKDTVKVFAWVTEFMQHHTRGLQARADYGLTMTTKFTNKKTKQKTKHVIPVEETKAREWWRSEGVYLDPDTDQVDWYDKRQELAETAFIAGYKLAVEHQKAVDEING